MIGWAAMLMAMTQKTTIIATPLMIPMAPTATSPPYLISWMLNRALMTLPASCMANGAMPMDMIPSTIDRSRRMFSGRSRSKLLPPVKCSSTQTLEMAMDITVATAAPATPILKTKMNSGSSRALQTAPTSMVYMAVLALPSALIRLFRPKPVPWNMLPHSTMVMYCRA